MNCMTCGNLATLTQRILDTMPQFKPNGPYGDCDLTCSQKTAQLIFNNFVPTAVGAAQTFLKSTESLTPSYSLLSDSQSSCNIAYSENDLRPVTKKEYAANVFHATGLHLYDDLGQNTYDSLPPDNLVTEYLNNVKVIIDANTQQSYANVANKVTERLSLNNFADVVSCSNISSEDCIAKLVDDFGCKAFRRPLTNEERANYSALYANTNSSSEGIAKVISAMLSSSNFIYRSNIGLGKIVASDSSSVALNNAQSLLEASKTLPIYEQRSVNAAFTGNDILEIKLKGTQSPSGLWPTLRLQVGNSTFVDLVVSETIETVYQFHITSLTGDNSILITNQQTGAALEYQGGQNLSISSVKLVRSE